MWCYNGESFDTPLDEHYGFVYKITNNIDGRIYIGKKVFWFKKTKMVKGKKKKYLAPSDWRTYYGSSPSLNRDITAIGADNFRRDIIMMCRSKGECSYYEAKTQFDLAVLLNPSLYYNDWIMCKIHRKHVLTSL